jgi:hypothetical protein
MNAKTAMLMAIVTGLAGALAGCNTAGSDPWVGRTDLPEETWKGTPDAIFFNYLVTEVPVLSQNDAYHAMLIWAEGEDPTDNFGDRLVELEKRGLVDKGWIHDPAAPITRGRVASMVVRYYDVRTSVALLLVGPSERAARRELEYRNVMAAGGGDWANLSGAEFVNVLKKADETFGEGDQVASAR